MRETDARKMQGRMGACSQQRGSLAFLGGGLEAEVEGLGKSTQVSQDAQLCWEEAGTVGGRDWCSESTR